MCAHVFAKEAEKLCREARQILDSSAHDRAAQAIGHYRRALEMAPGEQIEPYLALAYFACKAGLKPEAKVLLEQARQISPFSNVIQQLLSQLDGAAAPEAVALNFPDF